MVSAASGSGFAGFARGAAGAGDCLRLRRFGCGDNRGVPIEQPAAAIAGEQLALAELIPGLRTDAHTAAGTLLILSQRDCGATRGGDAIEARQPVRIERRADGFAGGVERGELSDELLLAGCGTGADTVKFSGKELHLGARLSEHGLVGLSALETRVFLVFQAVSFAGGKLNFVFDGLRLLGSLDGVQLFAETRGLLAGSRNFAVEARA